MDSESIRNMKVADLKKELKAKGISTIGNKSELIQRLIESLETNKELTNDNDDSVLNEDDDELGSDILEGSEGDGKGDDANGDALIEDVLLETPSEVKSLKLPIKSAPTKLTRDSILINKISPVKDVKNDDTQAKDSNKDESKSDEKKDKCENADDNDEKKPKVDVKVLTPEQRKEMRALKFGDGNKLNQRAERFGIMSPVNEGDDTEKLKKRSERFGAVVSDKMKKIDDADRLMKRKERFGAVTVSSMPTANIKRTITSDVEDRKRKRLERFQTLLK